jgi:hypothetical protein
VNGCTAKEKPDEIALGWALNVNACMDGLSLSRSDGMASHELGRCCCKC